MPTLKYSLSALTFPEQSHADDVRLVAASSATGLGIWEQKILDADRSALKRELDEEGIAVTITLPPVWSLFANPRFPEPTVPATRVALIGESVRRLAELQPACVMVTPGFPPDGMGDAEAHDFFAGALGQLSRIAAAHGTTIGLEVIRASSKSYVSTFRMALELLDELSETALGIVLDVYHVWDEPGIHELIRERAGTLVGAQLNDWHEPPRAKSDRLLPGDGAADVAEFVAALVAGGFDGWYDLEVMSDRSLRDSLWNLPPDEFMRRADERVAAVWAAGMALAGQSSNP